MAAEHYVRVYNEVYGLLTVSLQYFTLYSLRMRPNMAFTNFVSRCLNDESSVIYGDGTQTRDFTYVKHVADANESLLETDAADVGVVNIGSGGRITIDELAKLIRDDIDPSIEFVYADPRGGATPSTPIPTSRTRASCWATSRMCRLKKGHGCLPNGTR